MTLTINTQKLNVAHSN